MAVEDRKMAAQGRSTWKVYTFTGVPATSQTNVAFARFKPGFPFEIVAVRASARTTNAYTVPEVRIVDPGADTGQNVLTEALTATAVASNSPAEGTLQANRTLRRGRANQEVILHLTTGGTAPVNPCVEIWLRPYPLNGEV